MANSEHVELVKLGADALKKWWASTRDYRQLELQGADLRGVILIDADLADAQLEEASLREANLSGANLSEANLVETDLSRAVLTGADLSGADLYGANLFEADLSGADLTNTNLTRASFCRAKLDRTKLGGASVFHTLFAEANLSSTLGLSDLDHGGPCEIGINTLFKSQGKIPDRFLRGCGVPDVLITYIPSLIGAMERDPIQYQSCFISYSTKDDEFARRLYDRLCGKKLLVWFAPEDLRGGKKTMEQIDRAIQVNDRLLLVLSDMSLKSEWVRTEIRKARKVEKSENRQKLFPIRLVPFSKLEKWQCLDAETGEDLAHEVRQYHIPDFSNWKDHDAFEKAFTQLLDDLKSASEKV